MGPIKRCLTWWNSVKLAAACFIMHLTTLAWCFLFRNGGRLGAHWGGSKALWLFGDYVLHALYQVWICPFFQPCASSHNLKPRDSVCRVSDEKRRVSNETVFGNTLSNFCCWISHALYKLWVYLLVCICVAIWRLPGLVSIFFPFFLRGLGCLCIMFEFAFVCTICTCVFVYRYMGMYVASIRYRWRRITSADPPPCSGSRVMGAWVPLMLRNANSRSKLPSSGCLPPCIWSLGGRDGGASLGSPPGQGSTRFPLPPSTVVPLIIVINCDEKRGNNAPCLLITYTWTMCNPANREVITQSL